MNAAKAIDKASKELAVLIEMAHQEGTDVAQEEAVYDNIASTIDDFNAALASARKKLHFIAFSDDKAKAVCIENWDKNEDGELHQSEVAEVTDISTAFRYFFC
jgi:hypothetical protein